MNVKELYESMGLPPLLDGTIRTAEDWERTRRPALLRLLEEQEYGIRPLERPQGVQYTVTGEETGPKGIRRRDIAVSVPNPHGGDALRIRAYLYLPQENAGPRAAFMMLNMRWNPAFDAKPPFPGMENYFAYQAVTARGYALVSVNVDDAAADADDGFHNGVFSLFDGERNATSWGVLSAWGWAASRVLDYLETDPEVDAARVAVLGHSRLGKAALWAGARDSRFAMVIANSSGCGGAGISRDTRAETIEAITRNFPHWFCGNYRQWGNREHEAPFDQHTVLAMVAPRLLYVQSSAEDPFCYTPNEYRGAAATAPVYRLYGYAGLGDAVAQPLIDRPVHGDRVGYHVREGGHNLKLADWNWFMDFADTRL